MHGHWLRIAVLIQACGWFGWYVPVHERGAIRIAGSGAFPAGDSGCKWW
jgi:hypothetical protein